MFILRFIEHNSHLFELRLVCDVTQEAREERHEARVDAQRGGLRELLPVLFCEALLLERAASSAWRRRSSSSAFRRSSSARRASSARRRCSSSIWRCCSRRCSSILSTCCRRCSPSEAPAAAVSSNCSCCGESAPRTPSAAPASAPLANAPDCVAAHRAVAAARPLLRAFVPVRRVGAVAAPAARCAARREASICASSIRRLSSSCRCCSSSIRRLSSSCRCCSSSNRRFSCRCCSSSNRRLSSSCRCCSSTLLGQPDL